MTSSSNHILHFSLGPVQAWIQEGRRTRDLWSGSFLLSYLTAQAMAVVEEAGGEILRPTVSDDALYKAVRAARKGEAVDTPVWIGTLPNHFRARVPSNFDPENCTQAIQFKWHEIAQQVKETFLDPVLVECNATDIANILSVWEQQIGTADGAPPFWETQWVMGSDSGGASDEKWLDEVKYTRLPPEAPARGGVGKLCQLMSDMTELGGRLVGEQGRFDRRESKKLCKALNQQIAEVMYSNNATNTLELGDDERICAVALVRRLFPALPPDKRKTVIGWDPGEARRRTSRSGGTEAPEDERRVKFWPSTAHIAAAPWLRNAMAVAPDVLNTFNCQIDSTSNALGRAERYSACDQLSYANPQTKQRGVWTDGRCFFAEGADDFGLDHSIPEAWKTLKTLREASCVDHNPEAGSLIMRELGMPSSYYAIITADGDRMGAAFQGEAKDNLPAGLYAFAQTVRELFLGTKDTPAKLLGTLIYAGADDVLAMVPVDEALDAVFAIRTAWTEHVSVIDPSVTLSASIILTDMRTHMRRALAAGQALLSGWAKEKMDRNALAIRILRAGEAEPVWAAQFAKEQENCPVHALRRLIMAREGSNAQTYKLGARTPWMFCDELAVGAAIDAIRNLDGRMACPKISNQQAQTLIASIADTQKGEDWVTAGRLLYGQAAPTGKKWLNEQDRPFNPALLAVLRFMLEHRRPELGPPGNDSGASNTETMEAVNA